MNRNHLLTDNEADKIINEIWPVYHQYALTYLNDVNNLNAIIDESLKNNVPVKNHEVQLCEQFFKDTRKVLNPYTHKLPKIIKYFEENPGEVSISEANYRKLKEIASIARNWYKEYNDAIQSYRNNWSLYKCSFLSSYVIFTFPSSNDKC